MSNSVAWGIIGAGNIAKAFAKGVQGSRTGNLVAVGSRSMDKANQFADQWNIPNRHGSYEALLADAQVQAVYIATPHPMHAEWAIKAAEAKKHIIVEKPIGLNHAETMAVFESARANDVFAMEAYMYRSCPQTLKLIELLKEKAIGEVRLIQATFSFQSGFNPNGRLWSNALAGGGILDVGGYTTTMARLVAGVATGGEIAEPTSITGVARLHAETKVDEYAAATLKFPGDIIAQVSCGVGLNQDNSVRIYGTDGWIHIPNAWTPARDGGNISFTLHKKGQSPQEITIEQVMLYTYEVDAAGDAILKSHPPETPRSAAFPAMNWDDTLGNMKTLDAWRQAAGLIYDSEQFENIPTVTSRPLARRENHNMKFGRIDGLDMDLSRLVMGVDNITFPPHIAVMFDDFFERGGNVFDVAYVYGGGKCEQALGAWIKARGVRNQVAILGKGAHTPFCDPASVRKQMNESLDRLQTDHVDIYMMHRDNPAIPVGEFIDVLNELKDAGKCRVFGGSNWSIERINAANRYAKRKGKQGMSAISNNFSLAAMITPIWAGCIAASDRASRQWFTKTQTPLMPWSSQARGFFLPGVAAPDKTDNKELVRTWYSDDNFKRLARVNEMAEERNLRPINIALAYVLCQPFPTFPLIGPRTLHELHTSLPALDIELTDKDLAWLNLEEDLPRLKKRTPRPKKAAAAVDDGPH